MMQYFFDRVENFVGKGENAGYQHFLLFPQCFLNDSSSESSKVWIVWSWFNNVNKVIILCDLFKLSLYHTCENVIISKLSLLIKISDEVCMRERERARGRERDIV